MWSFLVWLFSIKIKVFSSYERYYLSDNADVYWKCEINDKLAGLWDEKCMYAYDYRNGKITQFTCFSLNQFKAHF